MSLQDRESLSALLDNETDDLELRRLLKSSAVSASSTGRPRTMSETRRALRGAMRANRWEAL